MTNSIDLDAYFSRIGYRGPKAATLETLQKLHALHPAAIAFENLDTLLGRRVHLDIASVQSKLIGELRGGYCYEQNGLFAGVLATLGFQVTGLAARVIFGQLPHMLRRSHMLLKVEVEGEVYVADVGFGGRSLSAPLRLYADGEQETPHGPFRFVRHGEYFEEQAPMNGAWQTLYRFSLEEQMPQDYEMANWYICTHPESDFRSRLLAARLPPGRRLALLNTQFTIYDTAGRVLERRELKNVPEIAGVLENEFAIALPSPRNELLAALARMVSLAH